MEIGITFHGGALDGIGAKTNSLDEIKLFFDDRNRLIHCYRRLFEGIYTFDGERSRKLSVMYDAARDRLGYNGANVRFEGDPTPLPDDQVPNTAPERPLLEKTKWIDSDRRPNEATPEDML